MRRFAWIVALGTVLALGACDTSASEDTLPEPSTSSTPAEVAESTSTTTSTTSTTTTTTVADTDDLPGDRVEFGPGQGHDVMVVGVSHDDVLNLRAGPGTDQDIIGRLAPHARVTALGHTRNLDGEFWIEVDHEGTRGWVHYGFAALEGPTEDLTSRVESELGGLPSAEDMEGLGMLVAEALATEAPRSEIVMSARPSVGDVGEVAYDVVGIGDDSVGGFRLQVFGSPYAEGFSLMSVEATTLCSRGVTEDGLCA